MSEKAIWEDEGRIRYGSDSYNCATVDIWCEKHGIWLEFHVGDVDDQFGTRNEEVIIRVLSKTQNEN